VNPAEIGMWIRCAKYCPLCAASLEKREVEGRIRPRCPACGCVLFENPTPAAAGLVLAEGPRVLLIRRALSPFEGAWARPAGYQALGESPIEAVTREVLEETGIEVEALRLLDLLYVLDNPRKPANLAVFLCRAIGGELRAGDDAAEVAWFSLDALPEEIAFDNRERILQPLIDDPERFTGR